MLPCMALSNGSWTHTGQVSLDKDVIFRYAGKRPKGDSDRDIYRISSTQGVVMLC